MGFFDFLFRKKPESKQEMSPKRYTVRDGKSVEVGSVFKAWGSGDLNKMLAALSDEAHLIDRHFLLQNIVDITYKSRNEESSRGKCKDIAETHISEFPSIAEAQIGRAHV